jgi:hypothetical protein
MRVSGRHHSQAELLPQERKCKKYYLSFTFEEESWEIDSRLARKEICRL